MRFPFTPDSVDASFSQRTSINDKSLKSITAALILGAGSLFSSTIFATSVNMMGGGDGSELSLQEVFDSLTSGGSSSVNVDTDQLSDSQDSLWSPTATAGSVATIMIEIAGYAPSNTFGIYDPGNPGSRVELFSGSATQADQTVLTIKADGSVFVNFEDTGVDLANNLFGYYLDSSPGKRGGLFFSDTPLNDDGFDHLVAYQGKNADTVQIPGLAAGLWTDNEYALAWEDITGGGDYDYQDFVVLVESVTPVPVPAALWLMGSGLISLFGTALFRRKNA